MSFRKRNVVVSSPGSRSSSLKSLDKVGAPGTRPSPLDGRLTTATGTRSLDGLLAGHAGLALGTSLLIEETGTTDFGGALLRQYAAEGLIQEHYVHVFGVNETWSRDLPGLRSPVEQQATITSVNQYAGDKMKIAWRYERLEEFGRDKTSASMSSMSSNSADQSQIFCHEFDVSKRLSVPDSSLLQFVPITTHGGLALKPTETSEAAFTAFLSHLTTQISAAAPTAIHRVVIPNLLSPATYPHSASLPDHILQFLHGFRALLRSHSTQLTAMITLSLSLYPRISGLTRWIEILSDGVLELTPFPLSSTSAHAPTAGTVYEASPQGMLKFHKLPIVHEKGAGSGEVGDDLAFTLSRQYGLVIKPFSLPPVDSETAEQIGGLETNHQEATEVDVEF